jgi:hypothetical protein
MPTREEGDDGSDGGLPSIRFTSRVFPLSAGVKDGCGLPWGASLCPLPRGGGREDAAFSGSALPTVDSCPRCESCYAYMNIFCEVYRRSWRCSICGYTGKLPAGYRSSRRYGLRFGVRNDPSPVRAERSSQVVDYELPLSYYSGQAAHPGSYLAKEPARARPCIYLALVDERGGDWYLQAVTASLTAIARALPAETRFGLLTLSDRLGVWDLQSSLPHVRYCPILSKSTPTRAADAEEWAGVSLSDLCSLSELTCELGEIPSDSEGSSESVLLSTLANIPDMCRDAENESPCHWEYALDQILELCAAVEGEGIVCCNVISFISGRIGLSSTAKSREFEEAAIACGLSISVHAIVEDEAAAGGDDLLEPFLGIVDATGGNAMLHRLPHRVPGEQRYEALESLVQTLRASEASGGEVWRCMLRIRCSPEFTVVPTGAWGGLLPDPDVEGLWRTSRYTRGNNYGIDLEFTVGSEMLAVGDGLREPALQVAFAYTSLQSGEGPSSCLQVVRRLRVMTVQVHASGDPAEVSTAADSEVIAASLLQKAVVEAKGSSDGAAALERARALLFDWAVNYMCCFKSFAGSTIADAFVVEAMDSPVAWNVLELVHGLIRCRLFDSGASLDERLSAHHTWSKLDPSWLRLCLAPQVWAWPAIPGAPPRELACCESAVKEAPWDVLVCDSLSTIVVMRRSALPLSPKSAVGQWLSQRLSVSSLWTEVTLGVEGGPEEYFLQQVLRRGGSGAGGPSLLEFRERIKDQVVTHDE